MFSTSVLNTNFCYIYIDSLQCITITGFISCNVVLFFVIVYTYSRAFHCILGEIFELKAELNSDKKDRKKEAVKKVIASMTVGKDVR